MKITSIKSQKIKNRVNVFLDDRFGFGLDGETFLKLGLKVGQELTEEQVLKLKGDNERQKLLSRVLRFVGIRPRSEKEIRRFLQARIPKENEEREDIVGWILEKLRGYNLLDDLAFARWWLEQRATFRPRGRRFLTFELKQKGISPEIIEKVLPEVKTDLVIAGELLKKKLAGVGKISPDRKKKLIVFLGRQGFSWETIKAALDHFSID